MKQKFKNKSVNKINKKSFSPESLLKRLKNLAFFPAEIEAFFQQEKVAANMTIPVRKRLGTTAYATFIKAHYKESGVKVYAGITVLGLLLTTWLAVIVYYDHYPNPIKYFTIASLLATISGFVGTAGAFPAMNKLWKSADYSITGITKLLDKFAFWHVISALAHIIAFILLLVIMIMI